MFLLDVVAYPTCATFECNGQLGNVTTVLESTHGHIVECANRAVSVVVVDMGVKLHYRLQWPICWLRHARASSSGRLFHVYVRHSQWMENKHIMADKRESVYMVWSHVHRQWRDRHCRVRSPAVSVSPNLNESSLMIKYSWSLYPRLGD